MDKSQEKIKLLKAKRKRNENVSEKSIKNYLTKNNNFYFIRSLK